MRPMLGPYSFLRRKVDCTLSRLRRAYKNTRCVCSDGMHEASFLPGLKVAGAQDPNQR